MPKSDKPTPPQPRLSHEQKGYQPKPLMEGYKPNPQGGHQPTSQNAPASPPSNPPNQGSSGKK